MAGSRGVDPAVEKRLVEMSEGVLIEEDVLGIVEKIQNYDPNLVVQMVDPARADWTDAPYRVLEICPDGLRRPVMDIWELDDRVVERIKKLDSHKHNVLADLDKINQRATEQGQRRFREENAALHEMIHAVVNSPKDTYTAVNPLTGERHTFRSLPHE